MERLARLLVWLLPRIRESRHRKKLFFSFFSAGNINMLKIFKRNTQRENIARICLRVARFGLFFSFIFFAMFVSVSAAAGKENIIDTIKTNLGTAGVTAGVTAKEPVSVEVILGQLMKYALLLLGSFFLALVVYGGYLWMTARGSEDDVKKATGIIRDAMIGLILVLGAWMITEYILYYTLKAAQFEL